MPGGDPDDGGEALPQQAGRCPGRRHGDQGEVVLPDRVPPAGRDPSSTACCFQKLRPGHGPSSRPPSRGDVLRPGGPGGVLDRLLPHGRQLPGEVAGGEPPRRPWCRGSSPGSRRSWVAPAGPGTPSRPPKSPATRRPRAPVGARGRRVQSGLTGAAPIDEVEHRGDLFAPPLAGEVDAVLAQPVAVVQHHALQVARAGLHRADVEHETLCHGRPPGPTGPRPPS